MRKYFNRLYFTLIAMLIALGVIITQGGFTNWRQGLDLAGGVKLLYGMDFSQYKKNYKTEAEFNQQRKNVVSIVKKNIDSRISKLGVSDYSARYVILGDKNYLEIELGGIDDIEKAKKIIGKTVQMTFKVPYEGAITQDIKNQRQLLAEKILGYVANGYYEQFLQYQQLKQALKNENLSEKDKQTIQKAILNLTGGETLSDYISNPRAWNIYSQQVELSGNQLKNIFKQDIANALTTGYVFPKLLEGTVQTVNVVTNKIETVPSFDIYKFLGKQGNNYVFLKISVAQKPNWIDAKEKGKLLNGERFQMATVGQDKSGKIGVNIQFDELGKELFCSITKKYFNKPMAIFIGNRLVTAPNIRAEICDGVASITGNYSFKEATKLKDDLNTGAMPVALKLSQEEKVSATLGEKAFKNALIAGGIGVVLIFVLFWIFYGFRYAIVTLASLAIFFITLGAFIKLFGVVLSLSAIGAILLNIGMAVDANVIIFERVREELASGSSFFTAVEKGYEHSISAIRDGNLTTGLIALLLFMIGTNIFRGFGTMMILNIFIVLAVMVPAIPGLLLLVKSKK